MSSILSASNNEKSEGTTTLSSQNIMTISLPPQTLPITSWDNLQADSKDLTTTGLGIDQAMSNPEMLINQSIQMGDMSGQMQGNLMVQNVANLNAQQQYVASQHALHRHQLKRQGTNPNIIPPLVAAIPPQMRPNMGVMINNNNINLPLQRDVFTQHHKQVQFLKIQQFRARQQLFVQPQGFGHGLMQNVGGSNPLLQQQFNQMQMLNQFPQQNQMDMMQSSFPIPHHDVFASIPDIPIDFNTQLNPNNLSISSSENQTTMSNFSNGLQNDPLLTNSIISQEHNGILQKEMNSKPDNLGSSDSYQGPTINGMKCDPVRTDLEEIEDFERYINSAPFIPNFNGGNINGNNINGNSHLNGNGQMGGKNGSEGPRNV
ncbi:hypothetical protein K502DRAFT_88535 [Neoconidiobolus thromboides FSU 785]|nr:hypothetical protein K502DRAFT_88535 [Neoconidiobolus thromboides FSU 785]